MPNQDFGAEKAPFPFPDVPSGNDKSCSPYNRAGKLIDLYSYPIRTTLRYLLMDKTTGKNIIWATDTYRQYGEGYRQENPITPELISGVYANLVQPRVLKAAEEQAARTKAKAEVMTPVWCVCKMVNFTDDDWFGRENVFGTLQGTVWTPTTGPIAFAKQNGWKKYVDSRRIEITCGEAPYLASRYDTTTGEEIPLQNRIGILDRKLRIVNENTDNEADWLTWTLRAYQSTYGYEYQGDNLLVARINLLMTFVEYMRARWRREPTKKELNKIANVLAWNLWQMDGLKGTIPGKELYISDDYEQLTLFASDYEQETLFGEAEKQSKQYECKIHNWRAMRTFPYNGTKGENGAMKWDYAIGNPPYQEDIKSKGDRPNPVYYTFMDAAYKIANTVELITPARFLFDAGQTPKEWNKKMLNDTHLKVLLYESEASKVFPSTEIKGGVAITLRDERKEFGKISVFTPYDELNHIYAKIKEKTPKDFMDDVVSPRGMFRLSTDFFAEFPDASAKVGKGTGNMIVSNIFDKLPEAFIDEPQQNRELYYAILGRTKGTRVYKFIRTKYVIDNEYIDKYKVFFPEANGNGQFGEALTLPEVGKPNEGSTDTFMSVGLFATEYEAVSEIKYIKTKFFRALLGIKKATQHTPKAVWGTIPLQNFTPNSDIDWTASIRDIDRQLYKKYGLSQQEIDFIESHVKEMA